MTGQIPWSDKASVFMWVARPHQEYRAQAKQEQGLAQDQLVWKFRAEEGQGCLHTRPTGEGGRLFPGHP